MMADAPKPHRRRFPWRQVAGVAAMAGVLGLVLLMYSQPGFLVMLGNMIWACFG